MHKSVYALVDTMVSEAWFTDSAYQIKFGMLYPLKDVTDLNAMIKMS